MTLRELEAQRDRWLEPPDEPRCPICHEDIDDDACPNCDHEDND